MPKHEKAVILFDFFINYVYNISVNKNGIGYQKYFVSDITKIKRLGCVIMYHINFDKPVHIHFIGIGGISMSGLAEVLLNRGFTVTGSDMRPSAITKHLENQNVRIFYPQSAANIQDGIDVVVYTAAIHPDNPEFAECIRRQLPMMDRAELLGQIMKNYKNSIAISGTHGKTTTTSMLSHVFLAAQKDPTISVGGILKAIHGNIRIGHSQNFITEACEYTNSFLKFHPRIELILNIEEDHMDFFKDIDDIRHSFKEFANLLPDDGLLVINGEIPNLHYIIGDLSCQVITYSLKGDADYTATNIIMSDKATPAFDLVYHGEVIDHIQLSVPGMHNVSNALATIATCRALHIPMEAIKEGLQAFEGTDRRFEYKGEVAGITVIDDYAHHPTEIKATLTAAKNYPHKTLWCVFQPHTYSRTKAFLNDFADALSLADKVVLADIYAAREKDPGDIHATDIQKLINEKGGEAYYFPSFDEIENFLLEKCIHGDLVITMGAGDIVLVGEHLLGK